MDSTKFLKLCKTAFVAVLLASCPTDAVRIQGKGCSIESTLQFTGVDPYLGVLPDELQNFLPDELQKQYNTVAPLLAKQFAAYPCDPSFENVIVNFDHLSSEVLGEADVGRKEIWLDPHKDDMALEALFTHEVAHLFQAYPSSMLKHYKWLAEGMATYAQYEFCPAEKNDWQSLLVGPGDHFRDGYEEAAGFLFWLERHKHKDIVSELHRRMQSGTFTEEAFLELTGRKVDELWKEYIDKQEEDIQKIVNKLDSDMKNVTITEEDLSHWIGKIADEIWKDYKGNKIKEMRKAEEKDKQDEEMRRIAERAAYKKVEKYAALLFIASIGSELVRRRLRRASRSLAEPLNIMERGETSSKHRAAIHEE